ncbi:MAG: hypothetical protein J5750_01405 [Clostridiales bacterium]|nr:hypothetical protein [Clostridiales bacterium]
MKCPLCGNENLDSTRFCIWCAAPLDNAAPAQPEQAPVAAAQTPAASAQPAAVPAAAPAQPAAPQSPYIPVQSAIPQGAPSYASPAGGMNTPIQAAYVAPGTAAPRQVTNVLCILGFIFSLVSIFCCGLTAIVSLILSILGLVFANKNNQKGKGLGIAGIAISAVMLAIFILYLATGRFHVNTNFNFGKKLDTPEKIEEYIKENNWIEIEEGSYLQFKSSKNFKYYRQYDELDDYYYSGTYELYVGDEAMDYIEDELSEYGVTREEVEGIADREELYEMDNLVVLVLHNEKQIIDGENILDKDVDTPYFGFFVTDKKGKEHALDIVNANQYTYCLFVPEDEYEDAKKAQKD